LARTSYFGRFQFLVEAVSHLEMEYIGPQTKVTNQPVLKVFRVQMQTESKINYHLAFKRTLTLNSTQVSRNYVFTFSRFKRDSTL